MNNFIELFQSSLSSGNFSFLLLLMVFLGGILTSLSPCNLAVLPLVLGYVVSSEEKNTSKIVLQLIMFFLGFSLIFALMGVVAALTGKVFNFLMKPYWVLLIASVVLIFGLNMIGILELNFPVFVKQFPTQAKNHRYFYAFLIGMVFALAATPCATPILAGIMAVSTLAKNITMAVIMLFLFSLGQSIIIILAGLFTSFLKNLRKLNFITQYATVFAGWLFIIFAFMLYAKVFMQFY